MTSVIIPYYNPDNSAETLRLLKRAVKSALSELAGLSAFEILIINDGSAVSPSAELTELGPNIICIDNQHGCLGAARNTGIDLAKGDILTFLDADDCYLPGTLACCISAMAESGADLLGFGFTETTDSDSPGAPTFSAPVFSAPVKGSDYMKQHNLFSSSCMYLIDKELLKQTGLRFVEGRPFEDDEFTAKLVFSSQRFIHTDYKVYSYYRHGGTITGTYSVEDFRKRAQCTLSSLSNLLIFKNEQEQRQDCGGLVRKLSFLTVDFLRLTLRRPDWRSCIRQHVKILCDMECFPLPCRPYGLKYNAFALLSRTGIGLWLLHLTEKTYK